MVYGGTRLMPKFTLICDHSNSLDTDVRTHTFKAEYIQDVLEHFEYFLKGAGYIFDGVVDIVPVDDGSTPLPELYDEQDIPSGKSPYYFDYMRNK
jgi:hypothetical protein